MEERDEYITQIIRPDSAEFRVRSFGFKTTNKTYSSAQL
jgi:hypothetical protein